jgi:hypothetical protein
MGHGSWACRDSWETGRLQRKLGPIQYIPLYGLNSKSTASLFLIPEAGSGLTGIESRHPVKKAKF